MTSPITQLLYPVETLRKRCKDSQRRGEQTGSTYPKAKTTHERGENNYTASLNLKGPTSKSNPFPPTGFFDSSHHHHLHATQDEPGDPSLPTRAPCTLCIAPPSNPLRRIPRCWREDTPKPNPLFPATKPARGPILDSHGRPCARI